MDKIDRIKLTKRLICLIFFILVINFLANKFYWYFAIPYFDMIMHFLGGFWVGLSYFYFFPIKTIFTSDFLKLLAFVLCIGLGWEVYEMLVNKAVAQNPLDYLDIGSDIFFDLLGGAVATVYFYKRIMLQLKDGPLEDSFQDRS